MLKMMKPVNEIYRVQYLLNEIKKGIYFNFPGVIENHKGYKGTILTDGLHRVWAHILNGDKEITVEVFKKNELYPNG